MAQNLHIIDMHCDTIATIYEKRMKGRPIRLRENGLHIDLERLAKSGYLVQNFALFVAKEMVDDPWEQVLRLYEVFREEMEINADRIGQVRCVADIEKNAAQGKLSALLTVEEGAVCKGEIEKLHALYDIGVRMMTFTWNYPNELGFPNLDSERSKKLRLAGKEAVKGGVTGEAYWKAQEELAEERWQHSVTPDGTRGLTERGKEFVSEMEAIGMIPDVSHLSDAGFWDVLACTHKPFVASHSNARAVCPHARNMTDDMIRALAERGGVMGLNFCADFLTLKKGAVKNPGTIADIVAHAKYIAKVGGVEVLGLGSDFDGIETHEELQGAQGMDRLADALGKGGFSQSDVDKILGQNVLRVYRDTIG